jgi:hypothetical protein
MNEEYPAKTRSKNYIPVIPNKQYYFRIDLGTGNVPQTYTYDSNKNFIEVKYGNTLDLGPNVYYIRFTYINSEYGSSTYQQDICINLSNPALNGEYHPYGEKAKYFPQGLLSAGDVYDEVHETYAIKYFILIDFGQFAWEYASQFQMFVCEGVPGKQYGKSLCSKYKPVAEWPSSNLEYAYNTFYTGTGYIYLKDSSFNGDVEAFRKAMKGVPFIYELPTPIRIDFDTPVNLNYAVADHGTEQQLPVSAYSPFNAPFVGTFECMSNFKEGVLDLMGRFSEFIPTTEIIPDSTTANSTLPTSQAVIDYMRAGGNGVKPVYESGDEVTPTTDVHAGLKTEVGNNSYEYYKVPFSAVTNDPSTGTSQVQIILNGNFS